MHIGEEKKENIIRHVEQQLEYLSTTEILLILFQKEFNFDEIC